MEINGLMRKCITLTNSASAASHVLYQSEQAKNFQNTQQDLYIFLKQLDNDDPIVYFSIEKIILTIDLQSRSNSFEEKNSNVAAIRQIDQALKALPLVLDEDSYKKLSQSYSEKHIRNGIPQDAVCVFIQSHIARLNNKLSAPLSVPEKNVLRQRKDNMRKAQELYTALQRKALGMVSPEKVRGLSRN